MLENIRGIKARQGNADVLPETGYPPRPDGDQIQIQF
jgi:hypothetical protein